MKPKVKAWLDFLMTVGLLFLMGYQLWGDAAHEWAGAGMFLLFIAHHGLNAGWHKSLFRGRYTPRRAVTLAVDVLTFLAMVGMMASGCVLSNHVFAFLPPRGGMGWARLAHLACSHWLFALLGLHLGLHWGMVLAAVRKALRLGPPTKARRGLALLAGAAVAVYGAVVFFRRGFPGVLFLRTQFAYLDFSEPIPLFYRDYLCLLGAFVFLGNLLGRLLAWQSGKKTHFRR